MITVKKVRAAITEHRCYLGGGKAPTMARGDEYRKPYRRCCIKDHRRIVKLSPKGFDTYGRVLYTKRKPDTPFTERGAVCAECSAAIRALITDAVDV